MPPRRLSTTLILLFSLSGFTGLIYESVWTQYLRLFLGHAAYAQTLVLAIFMGGMAAGAWLASRGTRRWKSLLRYYAYAEALIGLAAILFHPIFVKFMEVSFERVIPFLGSATGAAVFKWTSASLLIVPQAILLGATFPLMSAGLIRRFPQKPGETLAVLYFANSLGGAIGVLVSGFLLIRNIGLPGTITLAGFLNLFLASFVLALVGKTDDPEPARKPTSKSSDLSHSWDFRILLGVSLVTGAASFIYEIAWIRMLSLVLGSSTHSFELMLSAFIFGLALGGLWIRKRIDTLTNPVRALATIQIVMGLLALATLPLYLKTFDLMGWLLETLTRNETGYLLFNLAGQGISLLVMLPATFCAGMTLPLITFLLLRGGYGEKAIGFVYSANTVGAILGVVFAVHIGFSILGLKGLLCFGAALDMALGSAIILYFRRRYDKKTVLVSSLASFLIVAAALMLIRFDERKLASGVFRGSGLITESARVVEMSDGKTATIALTAYSSGTLSISTNGKPDASVSMADDSKPTKDEVTNILLGTIPLMANPRARDAAVIGIGSGVTTHALLGGDHLNHVDTIEIEREMVRLAHAFEDRYPRTFQDPRSRIFIEDAKTFFSTRNRRYDLIISEPSNPWVSGVAGLFSAEFYRHIKRQLRSDGILVQWIQTYEIDLPLVTSILKALGSEFNDYAAFASTHGDLILLATNESIVPELDDQILANPLLVTDLARIQIGSRQDIEIKRLGDKRMFDPWLASSGIRANSDYFPIVDQFAERSRFLERDAKSLIRLLEVPVPIIESLAKTERTWQISRFEPSDHFGELNAFFKATLIRDAVLRIEPAAQTLSDSSIHAAWQEAQRLRHECLETPPHGDRVFVLLEIARSTSAYLRPPEMASIWSALSSEPCVAELSGSERLWFELVQGLSNRDPVRTAAASRALLANPPGLTLARQQYLVASAMLGLLEMGDRPRCRQLWEQHRETISEQGEIPFTLSFLAAHCTQAV